MLRIAALVACLVLAGCSGSTFQEGPIGIGSGPNTLKQSPCACTVLPNSAAASNFDMG